MTSGGLLGRTVGRYRLDAELGTGAVATVYRATDLALDRLVAVKVLDGPARRDPSAARRFFHEGRLAARLDHPAIVAIYDVGEDDHLLYLAMRLVDGPSLATAPPLPSAIDDPLAVLHRIGGALDHAHARDVVHRDVKPSNILLEGGQPGRACLVDFGIATTVRTSGLFTTGAIGTAAYMAPEQATPGSAGPAADRYSLACVAYELVCGRRPFAGDDHVALLVRHATEPVPPTGWTALDEVFTRGLAKDPAGRPASCAELVAALQRVLMPAPTGINAGSAADATVAVEEGPTPTVTFPQPRPHRLLHPLVAATAALVLLAAVIAAGAWWWSGHVGSDGQRISDAAGIRYRLPSSAWRVGAVIPGRTILTRNGQPALVVGNAAAGAGEAPGRTLGDRCAGAPARTSVAGHPAARCRGRTILGGEGTLVAVVSGSTAWRFEAAANVPGPELDRFLASATF